MVSKKLVLGLAFVTFLSGCGTSGNNKDKYENRADSLMKILDKGVSLAKLEDYLVTSDGEMARNSTLYLSEFKFNNTELDEEILKILLDGLEITDKQYDRSTENEGYITVSAKYKGKDWDRYFRLGLVEYMKSNDEYKSSCDLGVGSGLNIEDNRKEYINALKSMSSKVPTIEGELEFTVNKVDDEYVIGTKNQAILDSLHIGNTYHGFSQTVLAATDIGGIVTESSGGSKENLNKYIKYFETYNKMVDSKKFNFTELYDSMLDMEDSLGSTSNTLLEDYAKDNVDWYNSLSDEDKQKVDNYLVEKGKIQYSLYDVYKSEGGNCSKGDLVSTNLVFLVGDSSIVVNENSCVSSVWQLFEELENRRYSLDMM